MLFKTQKSREMEAKLAALDKSQAIIEFNLDGKILRANKNFLNTVGYAADEIIGQHHSMFVDTAYKNSPEYREFWDKLRRGEYQAAQYKRLGKNGREVWIEASYNPLLNSFGKPYKVVKFATDITKKVNLLGDVNKSIAEIQQAVATVAHQAESASSAASQTSDNVRAVATGADQLNVSISEIAHNMSRSRAEADNAYGKAEDANHITQRLSQAAENMNGIVDLIRDITTKVNLLSLNATIEAARAGEAGKGFAVVASEVKNLASQAAQATDQISSEIEGMQNISAGVVGSLAEIRKSIDTVRNYVGGVATAVEEQSAVAQHMSSNMHMASNSVTEIGENISSIAMAVDVVNDAVGDTRKSAGGLVR